MPLKNALSIGQRNTISAENLGKNEQRAAVPGKTPEELRID